MTSRAMQPSSKPLIGQSRMPNLTKPPLSLLQAVIRPYGARLPKKPSRWGYRDYTKSFWDGTKWVDKKDDKAIVTVYNSIGGLQDCDFFYWWGSDVRSSNYSMCRVCQTICFGQRERDLHLANLVRGCRRYIYNAFECLRRDKRCAVCDMVTTRIRLGVYLCTEACEMLWKYDHTKSSKSLKEALRIVGYKDDLL